MPEFTKIDEAVLLDIAHEVGASPHAMWTIGNGDSGHKALHRLFDSGVLERGMRAAIDPLCADCGEQLGERVRDSGSVFYEPCGCTQAPAQSGGHPEGQFVRATIKATRFSDGGERGYEFTFLRADGSEHASPTRVYINDCPEVTIQTYMRAGETVYSQSPAQGSTKLRDHRDDFDDFMAADAKLKRDLDDAIAAHPAGSTALLERIAGAVERSELLLEHVVECDAGSAEETTRSRWARDKLSRVMSMREEARPPLDPDSERVREGYQRMREEADRDRPV